MVFADKLEDEAAVAGWAKMPVAEGGYSVGPVSLGVHLIPYAEVEVIDETDDHGQHFLPGKVGQDDVIIGGPAECRQSAAKGFQLSVFLSLPRQNESRMVDILLSAEIIDADGLDTPFLRRADLNVVPPGWNDKAVNAGQLCRVDDPLTQDVDIPKSRSF